MFRAKDLELLALDLLSAPELDFWIGRAAQDLLSKVGGSSKLIIEAKEAISNYSLPSWLLEYKGQPPPILPWLPVRAPLSESSTSKQTFRSTPGTPKSGFDKSKHQDMGSADRSNTRENKGECHGDEETEQHMEDEIIGLRTPPCLFEGRSGTLQEKVPSTALSNLLQDEGMLPDTSSRLIGVGVQSKAVEKILASSEAGPSPALHALAQSLRETWLERQPNLEDLHSLHTLPDPTAFLKLFKPWEIRDDVVLSMIEIFIRKDSGFVWSAQILSYCLLPKLLCLEQPASRFLVTAVMQAAKLHPRAAVDALLVPLVLCEKGPTKAQCDVINRMLKECLPDHHILSFCGKVFLASRRQQLPFSAPPFVLHDFLDKTLVWSEPACTVLQSILSHPISVDEELLDVLVNACGEEVVRFARSLKFSTFLLCLISNFGPCLKPHKSMLQRIAERTETFMTKSLIAKSSSL